MSSQIAVRIPDDLAAELQELVDRGAHDTVAAAVREGIRLVIADERRREVDAAIVEGYTQHPPTEPEERWADVAGRDMIAEEPW